jgi:hypothetical protein
MKEQTDEERRRVIQENKKDLNKSRKENGIAWQEINKLADRVASGEKLALQCWCSPKPCHGDNIKSAIAYVLRQRTLTKDNHPTP